MMAAAAPNFTEALPGQLRRFVVFHWMAILHEANRSSDPAAFAERAVAGWEASAREDATRRN